MDLHPVQLSGEPQELARMENLTRQSTWESKQSAETTPVTSNLVSPTPSSASIQSPNRSAERRTSGFQQPTPFDPSQHIPIDWASFHRPTSLPEDPPSTQATSERPVKVQKVHRDRDSSGALGGWIDALGVDATYQPPPERPIKPGKTASIPTCIHLANSLQLPASMCSSNLPTKPAEKTIIERCISCSARSKTSSTAFVANATSTPLVSHASPA